MFSRLTRRFAGLRSRRRPAGRQLQIEDLEGRTLLTAIPINFGATPMSPPVVVNGEMFFAANDPTHGVQLWESNGTAAGTVRLTDGNDANSGINPTDLTAVGGTLYFAADDLTHSAQLWKSDGTAAGTTMVTEANNGQGWFYGLYAYDLTAVGGTLYFDAIDTNPADAASADGVQLFESNGTAAGTMIVKDIPGANGYPGSYPADLSAAGSQLYFSATEGGYGSQLWTTNGTAAGTTMLTSGDAAGGGTAPQSPTAATGDVFFSGFDPTDKDQLWKSNGTAAGTARLTTANAATTGMNPQFLSASASTVYFSANDGVHGTQLWSNNGTTSTMLTSGNVAGGGLQPNDLTMVGNTLYFSADDGVHGTQLWSTNGTAAGTAMVADINGTTTADVTNITNLNGTACFAAYTNKNGFQIWQTNGTSAGTVMDTSLATGATNVPSDLTVESNDLYFMAPGATLWEWAPATAQTTPTITWATPAGITYGTALSSAQLDATASVAGTFAYSPAAGTVLKAGSDTLSVTFTPTDTTDYTTATGTVTLAVAQATPTITWANPAAITYGTALTSAQLDATASVAGTFVYSPAAGTVPKAGSDTLSVAFTPTDTTDYKTATGTVTLAVAQAAPTITWATPAGITYGTALSSAQLDATASVPGSFVYSPAAGTVPAAGTDTLSVTFTPTDTTDYSTATTTTTLVVLSANSATLLNQDTTTQGNWIGTYGSQGYDVIRSSSNLPSYATITPAHQANWTWASSTTDQRALKTAGGSSRIAACWYQSTSFSVTVNLTDGQAHDLELYFLDWDKAGRSEQVQITDATTGAVLSTTSVSSFASGVYLDYAVSGKVVITITRQAGPNAVLSGLFLDPSQGATTMSAAGARLSGPAMPGASAGSAASIEGMGAIPGDLTDVSGTTDITDSSMNGSRRREV